MNFELLKIGFKAYLEEKNQEQNSDYVIEDSEISIFMYANEFKDYITDELNLDTSVCSENINDILKMEIVNGKLVDPDAEENSNLIDSSIQSTESETINNEANTTQTGNTEISQDSTENTAAQSNINLEDSELITNMLNDLLQDSTFKSSLDADGDGEIKEEELTNFFNTIKGFDANESTISLDDIINAAQEIKDGSFKITTPETVQESVQAETPITSGATNSGSGISGSSNSGGSTSSKSSSDSSTTEKSLENMTKEELNAELTSAESELTEKQDILSSLLDGSEEVLQQMTENIETLYDTYLEELEKVDKDMADQVDTLQQDIDSKQDEVDSKDQEIADQEGVVSESENAYNNAVSTRENLEASLSTLESADTSNMESDKKAELNNKISGLKTQIAEAEEAEAKAKEAWDEAQEKLETLNTERETLQGELDELNTQMTELEAQIAEKYPQIQQYMDDYNAAKDEYNEYKQAATEAIKSEIQTAQTRVNEINTAINNLDNKESTKEYMLDGLTDLTRTAIELAYSQLGIYEDKGDNRGTMEKYGAGAGVPWCAAFVSWLYGKGQDGTESPISFDASVSGLRSQAQEAGYYSEVGTYTPVPGDIMIQKSNGASHTGIVVGVDDKYIYTIEGNSGDAVRERKYEIGSSSYQKISGWIRMNEWSGGSSDIPRDTYLANNDSEDANEKERSTL